ncbi:MAG: hypothetical protein HC902_11095 [Calothrix sp. SM1_5_4]|nr:hypothetical protein [Calothrix sp. SM1_5_4]
MNGDLSRYSNPLPSSLACNGCASSHYQTNGYGNMLAVTFNGNRNFYSGGTTLLWDASAAGPAQTVPGWPSGYTVSGITLNPSTKRLYVSASKGTPTENKIVIYNIAPTANATPGAPIKLTELDVSAQPGWSIQGPSMPGDIVIDSANTAGRTPNRVFAYLRGTGGLISFTDDGVSVPSAASLSTIGLGSIPSSASDVIATGYKIVYDPRSDLVWGVSREARVVFSIDPVTFQIVQKPTPAGFHGLWILPTGTFFAIDRANLRVYLGR